MTYDCLDVKLPPVKRKTQARPGPKLITLVSAPLEGVVVSAVTPSGGGHHLMIGSAAHQMCIKELGKLSH